MEIHFDKSQLNSFKSLMVQLDGQLPKALSRALNKTTTGVRTDMVSLIRKDYNYKAAAIRSRIKINRATYAQLSASVISSGRDVHLTDVTGTRQTAKGVSVNVKKSTGRKLIPRAFIRGVKSGKQIVFRRAEIGGKMVGRKPIVARYASHPETIYNTSENWTTLQKLAQGRLDSNFTHEVDTVLKGIA